jgi:hypothetical protein
VQVYDPSLVFFLGRDATPRSTFGLEKRFLDADALEP